MKHIIFFSLASAMIFSLANCSNEKQEVKYFEMNISYSPLRPEGKEHRITADSIFISYNDATTGNPMYYTRRWSDSEKATVRQMITSWNFNDFEKVPTTAASSNCNPPFTFMVMQDEEMYCDHLNMEKITEFYDFSKVINSWLPAEVQIGYTDDYLSNCQ